MIRHRCACGTLVSSDPDPSMIPFAKYTGAGNDFVVVLRREADDAEPARLARALCPRSTGVGVDGLAWLDSADGQGAAAGAGTAFRVRFFNPDGSEFATCGNGTRCVARYAVDRDVVPGPELRIDTADGPVEARVDGDRVALEYRLDAGVVDEVSVPLGERRTTGWLVTMGTPHLVLAVERLPEGDIEELARPLRHHAALGSEGANVNLVSLDDGGSGRIRTFERGVEAETLACGAGCMSAALALRAAGRGRRRLTLTTRSGEALEVALLPEPGSDELPPPERVVGRRIRLAGPARHVFDGTFPWPPG